MKRCPTCGQVIMDNAYFEEIEGTPEMHFLRLYDAWKTSKEKK